MAADLNETLTELTQRLIDGAFTPYLAGAKDKIVHMTVDYLKTKDVHLTEEQALTLIATIIVCVTVSVIMFIRLYREGYFAYKIQSMALKKFEEYDCDENGMMDKDELHLLLLEMTTEMNDFFGSTLMSPTTEVRDELFGILTLGGEKTGIEFDDFYNILTDVLQAKGILMVAYVQPILIPAIARSVQSIVEEPLRKMEVTPIKYLLDFLELRWKRFTATLFPFLPAEQDVYEFAVQRARQRVLERKAELQVSGVKTTDLKKIVREQRKKFQDIEEDEENFVNLVKHVGPTVTGMLKREAVDAVEELMEVEKKVKQDDKENAKPTDPNEPGSPAKPKDPTPTVVPKKTLEPVSA